MSTLTDEELQDTVNTYYRNYKNQRAAARELGLDPKTIRYRLSTAEKRGVEPDVECILPEGHDLKGTSTLYDADGKAKMTWVKTNKNLDKQKKIMLAAVDALKYTIPHEEKVTPPTAVLSDLLCQYTITDYHMGQLSWPDEVGEVWDLAIAEDMLMKWFGMAIKSAPDAETAILAQLGDFLHWDGLEPITPTGKNLLDVDTRFPKLVHVVIRVLRRIIQMLLKKHKHVHIIMAEGNHDMASSVWLRALFAEKYADEPRVTIDNTHSPYYAYKFGNTSLFYHHGHKANIGRVTEIFGGMYREIYGSTKYSYIHVGHLHHRDVKENSMMIVEQHPTLAAKDAYSARGGHLSQRGATVITYSKTAGEVSRLTIRPEMIFGEKEET